MAVLTAIITHLDAERIARQLTYLSSVSPASRFVICHGGRREDFESLDVDDAIFIEDPTLRGPDQEHSHNEVIFGVRERFVRHDPAIDFVYFIEYDHLILASDFEDRLVAVADESGAALLGKAASPRNDTNWPHYTRYRRDAEFDRFISRISRRDDRGARWGCLGSGMLFRRDALEAFCAIEGEPHVYVELFVPTVVHHLGFEVADFDAHGDLYAAVRWRPEYDVAGAIAEKSAGRVFVHPFKELEALDRIRSSPNGAR